MTLDCTNLKPDDRVRLGNGEIHNVNKNDGSDIPICLDNGNWYYGNGTQGYDDSPRNIAEILPPEPPADCTSQDQAIAKARQITENLRKHMEFTPVSSVATLAYENADIKHPDVIHCNGKRYVPADSPSLYTGTPFTIITHPKKGVVAIRYDGIKYTPADAWPEPITASSPTSDDADPDGNVQRLDSDGDWMRVPWDCLDCGGLCEHGWARTSDWKPRPTPAHTREEVLGILRDSKSIAGVSMAHAHDDPDLLASIITHLEASDE